MVLLAGAGLMIKTVLRMQQGNPGFDPRNVLLGTVDLSEGGKYVERIAGGDMERATPLVDSFFNLLLENVAALPGVQSVATVSEWDRGISFEILGRALPTEEHRPESNYSEVSPGFFSTLRIPLKQGRYIDRADGPGTPWVAVINQTFARRYFPNQNPIGQRVLLRYESYHIDEARPREIVGVVDDIKLDGLGRKISPAVYASSLQQPAVFPGGCILSHIHRIVFIRTPAGLFNRSSQLALDLRKAVAKLDPGQPVTSIMTAGKYLAGSIGDSQLVMHLLEIFAGIALVLAAIGIYGVMSYFVNERKHEIGIRMALGAKSADVLGLVTKLGLKLALIGIAVGIALALALTRLINNFLFDVTATDPPTFAAVTVLLISIALLACYPPGRRATKVDPMVALRQE